MRERLFEQAAPYKILLQSAVQFTVIYALYTCWFWSSGLYCCVDLYVHTSITSSTFSPEGWDSMFLWNVGVYLQVHRVLHHRRPTLISFNFLRTSSLIHYTFVTICWQSQRGISEEIAVSSSEWSQWCWCCHGASEMSTLSVQLFSEWQCSLLWIRCLISFPAYLFDQLNVKTHLKRSTDNQLHCEIWHVHH
jgi:hypothetical protein